MAELKLPTLQHFSTYSGISTDEIIAKILGKNGKGYGVSYTSLREKHVPDHFVIGTSLDQIRQCCKRFKMERNRNANLSVVDAIETYVKLHPGQKAIPIEARYFAIGKNMLVPVNPVCVFISKVEPKIFWPSFWKTPGKLEGLPSAIFGSVIRRTYFNRPEYRGVGLEFLDLSAPNKKGTRGATVHGLESFPDLTDGELRVETDKFLEAYLFCQSQMVKEKKEDRKPKEPPLTPLFPDWD